MNQSTRTWHTRDVADLAAAFGVDPATGMDDASAARALASVGPNELEAKGVKSPWRILWEQLTAVMMLILIGAGVLKLALGDYIDAVAILAIVVLNALLGLYQEYKAEQAMAALQRLASPNVRVRRGGQVREVAARELVPGDVVLVEAGNTVPADARVLEAANLRVQEAALTGESEAVDKSAAALERRDLPLGDRRNMLYMGTHVAYGRGVAMVMDTGMRTALGRIADLIQGVESGPTPLQRRIRQLGVFLAAAAFAIIGLMILAGVLRGEDPVEMFMAGIAVAVAAIPEGLPAVLTITLALGAQRMLTRRALIRKLPAVETLGSVTVICSDKTGTLTENKMQVRVLDVSGHTADLTELMRRGVPTLAAEDLPERLERPTLRLLVTAAALCNDASLTHDPETGALRALGDPTEAALLVAAEHYGKHKAELDTHVPRVGEVPFSSERKLMTTVHRLDAAAPASRAVTTVQSVLGTEVDRLLVVTKGAADGLLERCDRVYVAGDAVPLDAALRRRVAEAVDRLAGEGLRVLGVAYRVVAEHEAANGWAPLEAGLVFLGLVGMIDPPRAEVKDAVDTCRAAGIRPIMITGDHPLTALQIARELHIAPATGGRVITGQELEVMSAADLARAVADVSVFARVAPEHKLRIVGALQAQGQVVAMTGDGVNDAPALRKADIGVAMGITGTDVTKEAADMVITDDNFATIVRAVEEGRTIYDNVRKFVKYIVTSNTGEVSVMLLTQLAGMPLPMSTLQILWMNLVTDGVPGLALGQEPTEPDVMTRRPFAPTESIFSRGLGRHVVVIGALLAAVSFAVGWWAWRQGKPEWGTMVFMTLTLSQLGHALAVRSNQRSLFQIGVASNRLLLGAVLTTLALQLAVVYLPFLRALFGTVPLTAGDLVVCLLLSTVVFWAVELEKWLARHGNRTGQAGGGSTMTVSQVA
jgi:P-type Ca2+ transporter type 2C